MMTLVYRYGLLPPTSGEEKVREVLLTAHRFRNTRVEIERGRRAALREVERRAGLAFAEHAEAERWCAYGYDLIRAHKSEHRTNKIPAELKERLAECKRWRAALSTSIREARHTFREKFGIEYDAVNAMAKDLRRNARGYSGLASKGPHYGAHGTYQVVEESTDKLAARPLYDVKKGWAPNDPRFYRLKNGLLHVHDDGRAERYAEGTLGVQIKGGALVSELLSHSQLQIHPLARGNASPDSRRGRTGRLLRMRIGSTDPSGQEGIYAEWPMIMHRPLPDDARVMNARVHVRRVGTREEWYVTITVRTEVGRVPAERAGSVAINLGWRKVPSGIRVATWVGEDGGSGEIVCPETVLFRLGRSASIRSHRDEIFNLARDWFVLILADLKSTVEVPEWLLKETEGLPLWKSSRRLSEVTYLWGKRRFAGDEEAFAALRAWAMRNHHLYKYEVEERGNAERHRREVYRISAHHLAGRYTTLVHDDVDLSKLKTCPMVDAAEGDNERARANMYAAAPGECRDAIINAFRGDVAVENPVDITHTCPECGSIENFDAAIKISHKCGACGALWDQDYAAAENLLSRHIRERTNAPQTPDPARSPADAKTKESPRARSKRMARERAERLTARKEEDNAAE